MDVGIALPSAVPGATGAELVEVEMAGRGKRLDAMLERMREIWAADEVGPSVAAAPRVVVGGGADASFALGDSADADANAALGEYYAWLGEDIAAYIIASTAKDPETVRRYAAEFAEAGCGELIFCPSSSDPAQVDLLADAAGL